MLSLFNPYVLLGIFSTIFITFVGGYYKGSEAEKERQQIEIARLNAEAREKEQALVQAVNTTATNLVKANNYAKVQIQKRDAAIAAGAIKLRVPVTTTCPVPVSADATTPAGNISGSAELQPETARNILAVGDDADNTARKLNSCIQAYNEVRASLMKGVK